MHLKTLMGQGEAASLDYVTDPELRNLLTLVEEGKMPREDLPPIHKMLPRLQVRGRGEAGGGRAAVCGGGGGPGPRAQLVGQGKARLHLTR